MIHFHGTPIGGPRIDVARFAMGRFFFVPFGRTEDVPIVADAARGFAFDNGAFTAWKSGKPVKDWKPYYRFVNEWRCHPRFMFAIIPDVIDGSEEENRLQIGKWFQSVPPQVESVPVWHMHESLDYLRYMTEHFRTVAIGSSGRWSTPGTDAWWDRIGFAMSVLCDSEGRPKCRIHGLRMLSEMIVKRIPFSSADSTNAAQNSGLTKRFGMYAPPTASQRLEVIASRIESVQSPAIWQLHEQQELFELRA